MNLIRVTPTSGQCDQCGRTMSDLFAMTHDLDQPDKQFCTDECAERYSADLEAAWAERERRLAGWT